MEERGIRLKVKKQEVRLMVEEQGIRLIVEKQDVRLVVEEQGIRSMIEIQEIRLVVKEQGDLDHYPLGQMIRGQKRGTRLVVEEEQ